MKLTLNFQTLILLTLTVALTLATAVWAAFLYQSIYSIILSGFDRKLQALSGAAAEFTDGDGHLAFQRPYALRGLAVAADQRLWSFDSARAVLVTVDPADGSATEVTASGTPRNPEGPPAPMSPVRAMTFDHARNQLVVVSADGLAVYDAVADGAITFLVPEGMELPIEDVFFDDGRLLARRGQMLTELNSRTAPIKLAEEVELLNIAPAPARYIGLASSDSALVFFGRSGEVLRRLPLEPATHEITGLAFVGDTLIAVAGSLLHIDVVTGQVREDFAPGYYSEAHPYFKRHAPIYQKVREAAGLTFLYTEVHLGKDQIRYVLDGSVGDDHSPPGTLDVVPAESVTDVTLAQSKGQSFVSDIREWEEWGLIKVSGEPILAANGQVVALAGADVDIGVIRDKTRYALFAVIFIGVGLLLVAGWVSFRVSQGLMRPLRDIKESALRIAAGYLDTKVAYESSDEIGQLAQSLNALTSRLAAQAQQSLAYQQALKRGRDEIALEHALTDLLAVGSGRLPARFECTDESGMAHGNAEGALLWKFDNTIQEPLETCLQQVRVQQMAAGLMQKLGPAAACDSLFLTLESLTAVGYWELASSTLSIRCRSPMVLQLTDPDGRQHAIQLRDSLRITLLPGQRLQWGRGRVLLGPTTELVGAS